MPASTPLTVVHVEDDDVIREVTALGLSRLGYAVHSESDGLEGLEYLRSHPADLVLLDVMLPSLSGASICRRLREFSDVPVIMLSARDDSVDVVAGLDAGADDYVTKPVDLDILDARIRALLRRTRDRTHAVAGSEQQVPDAAGQGFATDSPSSGGVVGASSGDQGTDALGAGAALGGGPAAAQTAADPAPQSTAAGRGGDHAASGTGASGGNADAAPAQENHGLQIDHHRMEATLEGEVVHLTPTEWRILVMLVDADGGLVSRQQLLAGAWEDAWAGDGRLVDVHVQRLRRKVGPQRVETVRGFGYRWHE
ncbi:response regulator transcription factor [Galactobacter caseinivorans]|uniref:response regulator transcription factor n=1 Tax=Galactobacter caseinivorans TaxID=2676123 RepID=UPI002D787E47|nr:response regulator transcription factor [Galactobacter caseinivorans]